MQLPLVQQPDEAFDGEETPTTAEVSQENPISNQKMKKQSP